MHCSRIHRRWWREAQLPPAALGFDPPTSLEATGDMEFMLFRDGDSGWNDKVAATDLLGCVVFYDPESHSVCTAPSFRAPKFAPISLAVGNSCYVLDTDFILNNRGDCFDRFFHDGDWCCHPLPPPPYVYIYGSSVDDGMAHVDSYAIVGGSNIWISSSTLSTHCFDTVKHLWTKVGDWAMPFCGHAKYVLDHNLWFGLSADNIWCQEDDGSIYTSDLTMKPPAIHRAWGDDLTPPESKHKHLGHSRFCHARFFQTKHLVDVSYHRYVVLTGMEAEVCRGDLRLVKHRSKQYMLANKVGHWVL